ncbi:DMT family transporter [Candidatus Roizmanbacteria bacterium]|nr:DMT family transporter [Candidatus Roizmanbacteria bacterium]
MSSAFVNVSLFSLFWAIQIFISKVGYRAGAEVVPFTIQTNFFAILLITLYVLIFKRASLKQLTLYTLSGLVIANAIHNGFGSFFSNAGISLTTAINAGFLIQFTTVTTSLLAWTILKERMTLSKAITIAAIMVGTFLLVTKGQMITPHIGDVLLLLACLSWSTGNVLVKKIVSKHPVDNDAVTFLRPIAEVPVFLGFIMAAPLYPVTTQKMFQANIFDIHYLGYAFLNGFFVILLWIFLNRTLKVASASYMTMMSSLTPVLVALLAIAFLHESLEPIQWGGVFIIIISSYVTQIINIEKH